MLFLAGKLILQTLREKKSNRKLIGIGYLFGLTHHNIFGLSNGQRKVAEIKVAGRNEGGERC